MAFRVNEYWPRFAGRPRAAITRLLCSERFSMTLVPKPGVLDIIPYVGGRAHVPGVEQTSKLSSNESALGPRAQAPQAFAAAAQGPPTHPYPRAHLPPPTPLPPYPL